MAEEFKLPFVLLDWNDRVKAEARPQVLEEHAIDFVIWRAS